jgi:hypothetical protein
MARNLVLLLTFAVLAGCAKKEAASPPATASTPAVSPASTASTPPQPAPTATTATTSTTTTTLAPPAASIVASADGEKPGTKVEVMELKRGSGGTVTLKMAFVNDSENAIGFGYNFADADHQIIDHGSIGAVQLVDPVGKKKYFVARDADGKCVCSVHVPDVAPHTRLSLWAKFPAPPDDVQKISIVIPHFQPLDDVTISR